MSEHQNDPDPLVAPGCRESVELLQGVLDGDRSASALDSDPHVQDCLDCRQRVAAARLLVSVLATPGPSTTPPATLSDRVVDAIARERRSRRRLAAVSGGLLVAAAVVLAVWLGWTPEGNHEMAEHEPAPVPGDVSAPRAIKIGDEITRAGLALLDAPKAITDSTTAAPLVIAKVADAFSAAPAAVDIESPPTAIAAIPDMARAGLEPVTGTAQKAFARLIRDVGSVQISAKPKS